MKGYFFLVVNLAVLSAFSQNPNKVQIVDVGEDKDIEDANRDLLDDDILESPNSRSAVLDESRLWTSPVPYVLGKDLDLNTKGVLMKAFDQFRLKSCIDFKPRDSEYYYISIKKLKGCSSGIGQKGKKKGQVLSLAGYCAEVSTIEHEFLHALGFYHEQSRYDRDNYVNIAFENIKEGFENNFRKVSNETSTTQGVPYDYWSVMHYNKNAFSEGKGPTIITKDPTFQDVIGQRWDMSPSDVLELNLLYKCNSSIAFKMYCGFSNGTMCQMDRCSQGGSGWEMVTHVSGGPRSDHTNLPSGGDQGHDAGYFMHASTASGQEGDSALLETHKMRHNRECHVQCLQFYYYHSGHKSDHLNIWIREFQDEWDLSGTRRLMGQITGPPTSYWQLKHVSLNVTKHFQVEFEVRKGAGNSSGGFSIDDINLSETDCPHVTMQIDDFENTRSTTLYSPRQYSSGGYAYRVGIALASRSFGLFVQLLSGEYDDKLEWPCPQRLTTFKMLDQNPNIQLQMSKQRSIISDLSTSSINGSYQWDNPRMIGTPYVDENNETIFAGPPLGRRFFAYYEDMKPRDFIKGGSAIFEFSFQDISPLVNGSSLPCPKVEPMKIRHPPRYQDNGPCSSRFGILGILPTTRPPPNTTDDKWILPTTRPPPNTTDDKWILPTTRPPPNTTDDKWILPTTRPPPNTTDDKWILPTTRPPPNTTDDKSVFGFSAGLVCSPVLTLLLALMVLTP